MGLSMLHASTIGGYVLEEVLARLLADNGYVLLTSDSQDPVHLLRDKHGLLVRGRGTDHQADALGDLHVPVPFSLPVRLFAEAKNRAHRTGLDAVRNGMGVVSDVNQFQLAGAGGKAWRNTSYHYRYSIFSTSGFTAPAQDFALAHQLSLIDLSGPSFAPLRQAVELCASAAHALAVRERLKTFPIGQLRASLRSALGTVGGPVEEADPSTRSVPAMPWPELLVIANDLAAATVGDMVLGFPTSQQVLALKPDDPESFRQWTAQANALVPAQLRYAPGQPHGEWIALPSGGPAGRRIVLRFGLPPALAEWLFAPEGDTRRRLNEVARGFLSAITIYQNGRSIVLQLDLDAERPFEDVSRDEFLERLQEERLDRELAWEPEEAAQPETLERWTVEATGRFVDLLRQRDPNRLTVLLYAAWHDNWISRAHLYELMDFDPYRKMTGFTKPYEGVRRRLVKEGFISSSVANPLMPRYPDRGGWALGMDLDREMGRTLRRAFPTLWQEADL